MNKLFQFPQNIGWRDHLVGALLAIGVVTWLLISADAIGFARDEGFYFRAAAQYGGWFRLLYNDPSHAFERAVIDRMWGYNHEHPSLIKSLFSLSWLLLNQKWKILEAPSDAFRFPAMVLSGVAVWVTYLFGAHVYSRRAGLVAAVLFLMMPRIFYHAHLACFDLPVVAMWTLCIYVYWRSLERGGVGWMLIAGLVYGLTLETKHNAWILPAVFLPHALFFIGHRLRSDLSKNTIPVPASLIGMAIIGPIVFWALWPWMWHDTSARFREYFDFHFNHVYYNMEFLGRNYFGAPSPRGYMPLMLVATVPSTTLLLCVVGATHRLTHGWTSMVQAWRDRAQNHLPKRRTYPNLLFGLAMMASLAPWLLSSGTPIFGGTKHWITAYPFIALFAAHGCELVLSSMNKLLGRFPRLVRRSFQVLALVLVVTPAAAISVHAQPFGLSSYVPFIGGTRGGATLGLNRQFWGFTTQNANEEYLQQNAPRDAKVFIHDTAWDSWGRMIEEGRMRSDIRGVNAPCAGDYALLHHELHMNEVEYQMWIGFKTRAPVYVVTQDEVPIVSIYKRP